MSQSAENPIVDQDNSCSIIWSRNTGVDQIPTETIASVLGPPVNNNEQGPLYLG